MPCKFSLFASVHHVPHEVNPFDAGLARAYHLFVDDSGELDGTLHHHTVGDDGREDIVHLGNGLHHIGIVDCSRQVEEHEIEVGLRCHQIFGGLYRIFRTAASDGVRVLLQSFELLIRQHLVMPVLHDGSRHACACHGYCTAGNRSPPRLRCSLSHSADSLLQALSGLSYPLHLSAWRLPHKLLLSFV